jgi:transcriptional regulator with GAF, ATPase, and Fis domain
MFRIDETVPNDPLQAEVVLHVRQLLRKMVRRRNDAAGAALGFLFGFPRDSDLAERWILAARSEQPFQAGAALAAELRNVRDGVVEFGHDEAHMRRCHQFLLERKHQDGCFSAIVATDLATLLELSKARELAVAKSTDVDGRQRPLAILVRGDTGTGKELVARAIHELATQASGETTAPFEVLHVAGMSSDMLNDELFGHVRGAYTDAKNARPGRLELADGGTLLIDEVGDLPDAAQLRLLRFLQDQRVSRQGTDTDRQLCVRVIAATWRNLDEDVLGHRFRLDLLHRLRAGSDLVLPPLRERRGAFDEVLPSLLHNLGHKASPLIARSARDALALHDWPGNLRELVGVLQQALAFADGETLRVEHLPTHLQRKYLSVPLYQRPLGYLCDELDGQRLDEVLADWRVAQVQASLDATPPPAASDEAARVLKFLSFLDDTSEEHRDVKRAFERGTTLIQFHSKQLGIAEYWQKLLTADLHPSVRAAVELKLATLTRENDLRRSEVETLGSEMKLERHPWLSMLNDLQQSPLLREQPDSVMAAFLGVFNLLRVIAPGAIDAIRESYKNDGLSGVRARIIETLDEDDSGAPAEIEALRGRLPHELSVEDWKRVAQLPTMSAARRATDIDPKTINKYLARHGIVPLWAERKALDATGSAK